MPRKFSDKVKREWLERYENDDTEKQIAKDARCDVRTVRKGIEEARKKQDARVVRVELLKEALRQHRDSLLRELGQIAGGFSALARESVVISWDMGDDYILKATESPEAIASYVSEYTKATRYPGGAVRSLLKEHLKRDRLWKELAEYDRAYVANLAAKLTLQRQTVAVMQTKTGCKIVSDAKDADKPFIYSYIAGDLFFKTVLRRAFGEDKDNDFESRVIANTTSGGVMYGGSFLAECPGVEKRIRDSLLEAFRELDGSPGAIQAATTYKKVQESAMRVVNIVEQIKLLGLLPGQCAICRRLGM